LGLSILQVAGWPIEEIAVRPHGGGKSSQLKGNFSVKASMMRVGLEYWQLSGMVPEIELYDIYNLTILV
jgi:hypothetical protein